jgi:broad specificity phosphatase PhoE
MDQARLLADRLADKTFHALYASDLMRARQTAEIIAGRVNLPIKFDRRLREIAQGEVEGMLLSEVRAKQAGSLEDRVRDPINARMPGGESVAEVAERFREAINEIAVKHSGEVVLVASHGLAIATILCQVRNFPLETVYSHIQENATAEIIEWVPTKI